MVNTTQIRSEKQKHQNNTVLILVEYLRCVLMYNGIIPMSEKISVILAIDASRSVKELCRFLGMISNYPYLWGECSKRLAILFDLAGECVYIPKIHIGISPRRNLDIVMINTK